MFLDLKPRRKLLTSALFTAIASFALSAATVQAQSAYPNKPVKMVVAFAPGTASDIIGRLVAEKLSQSMGQSFVVE
ncbi:MAG: ABC transporter substrate-binding protein, partial [Burkholderiaceae bacterium]